MEKRSIVPIRYDDEENRRDRKYPVISGYITFLRFGSYFFFGIAIASSVFVASASIWLFLLASPLLAMVALLGLAFRMGAEDQQRELDVERNTREMTAELKRKRT